MLTKADRILNDVRHEIDFPEYFVLGYAQLSFGNNDLAIDYYQRAYAVASTELSKAESLRGYAQAVLSPGPGQDMALAREQFQKALAHSVNATSYAALSVRVNIYAAWIIGEIYFGDCDGAKSLLETLLSQQDVMAAAANEMKFAQSMIKQQASGQPKCRHPPYW